MADYPVGTAGTLRIIDDGTNVRFYVLCSDPYTSVGSYTGAIYVNGVNVPFNVSLGSGFGSRLLATWTVSASQNVGLGQNATGTSGLGGDASFGVYIARSTTPPAPIPLGVDQATASTLRYRFSSNGDGGSPVTSWTAQVATNAAFTTGVQTLTSSGTTTFTGLSSATTYYFRARGNNAYGAGAWSATMTGLTDTGAYVSKNGVWVGIPIYVSDGTAWEIPELLISDGTDWVEAI